MDPSTPATASASVKPISGHLVGGRYEILGKIASGGMGTVYKARHAVTRQRVALKLLDASLARDETVLERFLREARVGALIEHEGICKVFDAGVDDDPQHGRRPFVAMEQLFGQDLAGYLGRGRSRAAEGVELVVRVLEPLAAAHALGIVHRDLKPENIFIELDAEDRVTRVRLLDFGVAHIPDADLSLTADGTTLGTVYYMPPEQCLDARSVTPATDVYALAVILYQILGGVFPFDGDSAHAILIRAGSVEAMPLHHYANGIDPRLEALVDQCLRKNPALRPQNAGALRDALHAICDDPSVRAWLSACRVDPSTFSDEPPNDPFSNRPPALSATLKATSDDDPPETPSSPVPLPPAPEVSSAPTMPPPPSLAPAATPPSRPSRGMPIALGAAALLGLLACVGVWSLLRPRAPTTASVAPRAPMPAAMSPSEPVMPVTPVMPVPAAPVAAPPAPMPVARELAPMLGADRPMARRARRESPASSAMPAPAAPPVVAALPAPVVPAPVPTPAPPPAPTLRPVVAPEPSVAHATAPELPVARPTPSPPPPAAPGRPATPPPAPDFVTF